MQRKRVTADHLRKQAILYVRQSTLHQVKENRESTLCSTISAPCTRARLERKTDSRDRRGSWAQRRLPPWTEWIPALVAEVSLGRVGLVMGLSVSRLARNTRTGIDSGDMWLTGTLIVDEDGNTIRIHFTTV